MKYPKYAKLLLHRNERYPIVKLHFQSGQVTLQEKSKLFNTVSIQSVEFDFNGFSEMEIKSFFDRFK